MVLSRQVTQTHNGTGEGPLWHPDEERLYWVDIPAGRLFGYDPLNDTYEVVYETEGRPIGGFTIESDGALLLFTKRTIERLVPDNSDSTIIAEIDADTRFNDVIADPEGRVFCGTMPGDERLGDLYRLDTDGTATVVIEDVDISNGMGFSADLETFYFTESEAQRIYAFEYDRETGELSDRRTFRETSDDGVPDGLTVDADDHVWSARWNGGKVVRYAPDGEQITEIELPARKVSSVTFGGPEYEELYVTTALSGGDRSTEGEGAGSLFRLSDVGVGGTPEFRSRIASDHAASDQTGSWESRNT